MKYICQLSAYETAEETISPKTSAFKALDLPEYGPVRIIEANSEDEAREMYYELYADDVDAHNYLKHLHSKHLP